MTDAFLPPIDVSPAPDPTSSLAQLILDKVSDSRTTTARGTVIAIGTNGTVTFSVGDYGTPRQGTYLGPTVPQVGEVIIYLNEGSGWPLVLGASGPRDLSIDATKAFVVGNTRVANSGVTSASFATQAWTLPTLQNGWTHFGGIFTGAYYRKVGDEVQLRGLVKNGTVGAGTPIFTLPVGFRPLAYEIFVILTYNNVAGRLNVGADGTVACETGNTNFVSLGGVRFTTT